MKNISDRPALLAVLLILGALLVRVLLLACLGHSTGTEWRNLALMYDGHFYIIISQTFPTPYTGLQEAFPLFKDSVVFTGWFPVYPFLIYLVDFLLGDPRVSALAVSMLAGSLSVGLLYRLGAKLGSTRALAATVFIFFTPTWLLVSTLAFVESVYLCLFLGALLCFIGGRTKSAVLLAGLTIITQKSGVLILPIIGLSLLWQHGPRGAIRRFMPYLLSLLPLVLMQVWIYHLYGDLFANLKVLRQAGYPDVFGFPFTAFIRELLRDGQIFTGHFVLRKILLALSCLFFAGTFAASWRGRGERERLVLIWLGVVLLFNLSLAGQWAYYAFPRFLTLALPAAIILLANRLPASLTPRRLAPLLLLIPLIFWIVIQDVSSANDLMMRAWPRGYFDVLLRQLLN